MESKEELKKVLIIDDDISILKVLEISLGLLKFEVETATSAEEAFHKLREKSFDVVVIDYYLPKIGGTELCQSLKINAEYEKNKSTPVIILSGKMETPDAMLEEVKKFGASDFLAKPFEVKDLVKKINVLLNENTNI